MKKLVMSLIALFSFCSISFADWGFQSIVSGFKNTVEALEEVKHGAYLSFVDNVFNYTAQVSYLNTNDMKVKGIHLNTGVGGDADSTDWKWVNSLSYELNKLSVFGVTMPFKDKVSVEPYICLGVGNINIGNLQDSETDWGIGLQVKF